jgi:hypothetical protein
MDQNLEELCLKDPQQLHNVVITLAKEAQHLRAADLGLAEAEEIMPGILKGALRGEQLLELRKRSEVEEITEDIEVSIF